jgi:hypothetical protein
MQPTGQNPSGLGGGELPEGGVQGETGPSVAHAEAEVVLPEGGPSDQLSAQAQATGDGTTADPTRVEGPTAANRATVPVRDVVGDYRRRAVDSLDSLSLAPSETAVVQEYFDQLAATTGG